LVGDQTAPRKGRESWTSNLLALLAVMNSCSVGESSLSTAHRATPSATSEVASRLHPSHGLKATIRTGQVYPPEDVPDHGFEVGIGFVGFAPSAASA
jgi:hypothetical protein